MRYEVERHEEEENRHSEARENFCSLKSEGMSDGGAFPHFEVAEYIYNHAYRRTNRIKENKMGKRSKCQ